MASRLQSTPGQIVQQFKSNVYFIVGSTNHYLKSQVEFGKASLLSHQSVLHAVVRNQSKLLFVCASTDAS